MITVNLPRNSTIIVVGRPGNYKNRCGTGEECECEELLWRRGSPLTWRVMCFVNSIVVSSAALLPFINGKL